MTGATSKGGGRPLAYRIGQLLAIAEKIDPKTGEHNPRLMQTAFSTPWLVISQYQTKVLESQKRAPEKACF